MNIVAKRGLGVEHPPVEVSGEHVEVQRPEGFGHEPDLARCHQTIEPGERRAVLSNRCSACRSPGGDEQSLLRTAATARRSGCSSCPRPSNTTRRRTTSRAPLGPDAGRLRGSVALVTGAGRGVGRLVATSFADAGAAVAMIARSGDELDRTLESISTQRRHRGRRGRRRHRSRRPRRGGGRPPRTSWVRPICSSTTPGSSVPPDRCGRSSSTSGGRR